MILRLQSEEELELLQSRIKAKSTSIKGHMNGLREERGTGLNAASQAQSALVAANEIQALDVGPKLANAAQDASRKPQKGPKSTFEHQLLGRQLTQAGIAFREEFRFEPKRRWRFDFLVDNYGIEIQGGMWMKRGGHSGGQGQIDDMEKFTHAAILGYWMLYFTPQQVKDETAIRLISKALSGARFG